MTDHDETTETARMRLASMLARHECEREALTLQLMEEERDAAAALRRGFDQNAGHALTEALADVERQLRQDRRAGTLMAVIETTLPHWADRPFPMPDADDRAEGRRRVILFLPRLGADGRRERLALAMFDASDIVFPAKVPELIERGVDDADDQEATG